MHAVFCKVFQYTFSVLDEHFFLFSFTKQESVLLYFPAYSAFFWFFCYLHKNAIGKPNTLQAAPALQKDGSFEFLFCIRHSPCKADRQQLAGLFCGKIFPFS